MHEIVKTFVMVGYIREMTAKLSGNRMMLMAHLNICSFCFCLYEQCMDLLNDVFVHLLILSNTWEVMNL